MAATQVSVWKQMLAARTSFVGAQPAARCIPGVWGALAAPPGLGGTCTPASHCTHLIEDDPGRLPGERLCRPRRALPRPPKEVPIGDIEEGHTQVAVHLQ